MTTALAYPNTDGLRTRILEWTDAANALEVCDAVSYKTGAALLKEIKAVLKEIGDTFDEPIKDAHIAHRAMIAAKKKHTEPREVAEYIVKGKMVKWQRAETDRVEADRRVLEAAERKREEDRRLAAAERLEAQGRTAEAEAVIDEPVVTAPIVMPPAAPKVAGISTRRVWKFRIVDVELIPYRYMMPNEVAIRATVQAMGKAANIPGVEVFPDDIMAVR